MLNTTVEEIAALGYEINQNHYRIVRLAARYDRELDWLQQDYSSPSLAISRALDIQTSTAREWVRVGHALDSLPLIEEAFARNEPSYAKVRIVTRSAHADNEAELLDLAHQHSANRLTIEIAKLLSRNENDEDRDQRHQDERSVTVCTDANGMIVIRAVLPPSIGKPVAEALNTLVDRVASTPLDETPPQDTDLRAPKDTAPRPEAVAPAADAVLPGAVASGASADASPPPSVRHSTTQRRFQASAETEQTRSLTTQLRELKARWQAADDAPFIPTLAQQRADAFALLFLGTDVAITTEVILHVRGDGATFDDGTPITNNAVTKQIDDSFIRLLIHDNNRKPIDATNKRRHPTTRQSGLFSKPTTMNVSIAKAPTYSNSTTTLHTNKRGTPSPPNSNPAAPPATERATAA